MVNKQKNNKKKNALKKVSIDQTIKKAQKKITIDDKVHDSSVKITTRDGEFIEYEYSYKKLKKEDYLIADSATNIIDVFDTLLSKTLYNREEDRFYTLEEVNDYINPLIQNHIVGQILEDSGYTVKAESMGF